MNIGEIRKNEKKAKELKRKGIKEIGDNLKIMVRDDGVQIMDKRNEFFFFLSDDGARRLRDVLNRWFPVEKGEVKR